jgi:hypothetical protein
MPAKFAAVCCATFEGSDILLEWEPQVVAEGWIQSKASEQLVLGF